MIGIKSNLYLSSPDTTHHWPRQPQSGSQRTDTVCVGNRNPKGARAVSLTSNEVDIKPPLEERKRLSHMNPEDTTVVDMHAPDSGSPNTSAKGGKKTDRE